MIPSAKRTAANRFYDELLAGEHFTSTCEVLDKALQDPGLRYDGRPIIEVLRPFFLSVPEYRALQATTNRVMEAIVIAMRHLRVDVPMQQLLDIEPHMLTFNRHDAAPYGPMWQRLDGMIGPDNELRFVEINSYPDAALLNNLLGHLYDRLPIMNAFRRRFVTRPVQTVPHILDALRPKVPAPGEYRTANIGMILSPSQPVDRDTYLLDVVGEGDRVQAFLDQNGGQAIAGTLDEFSLHNGRLVLHGEPIDLLLTTDVDHLVQVGTSHPTHRAMELGVTRLLTDYLWRRAVSAKAIFEVLTDSAYADVFGKELFAFLLDHVPWTRRVSQRKTTRGAEVVDLVPYIIANQERLVLKPNRGTKGGGVVLGWQCSAAEWRETLERCAVRPHVVQERISAEDLLHPVNEGGTLKHVPLATDFAPYVWETAGADAALIRTSKSGVSNLGAGGTMTALFLVD